MKTRALILSGVIVLALGCTHVRPNAETAANVPASVPAPYTLADIKAPVPARNGSADLQVPGVTAPMLTAEYWIAQLDDPNKTLHTPEEIAHLNANTYTQAANLYALDALPPTLPGAVVQNAITQLAKAAKPTLINAHGKLTVTGTVNSELTVPVTVNVRWGTVVDRADLRAVPSDVRAYSKAEDIEINIDRLQESAVFPGWAVAILHSSADGQWYFVNAYNYRAWVKADAIRVVDKQAALARNAAVQPTQLPYTRANILRTAFRYLGEAYGWGHARGTRDCSGFVSEVYAAVGIVMPRNTGDQRDIPNFHATRFTAKSTHAERMQAINAALPGDLIFIPGHVMMVLGRWNGLTYVIHDTPGVRIANHALPLYGVSVTPLETLEPLSGDSKLRYIDMIQAITRPLQ